MSAAPATDVPVAGPLSLGAFVKLCGAAGTGGHAKVLIQSGLVVVNGEVETRRAHHVAAGDGVVVEGVAFRLVAAGEDAATSDR